MDLVQESQDFLDLVQESQDFVVPSRDSRGKNFYDLRVIHLWFKKDTPVKPYFDVDFKDEQNFEFNKQFADELFGTRMHELKEEFGEDADIIWKADHRYYYRSKEVKNKETKQKETVEEEYFKYSRTISLSMVLLLLQLS